MTPAPRFQYPRVLSIAGSDSGGGAGIQADLKTIAALGCYGMTAITALTAQNTTGVRAIHGVPAQMLADQIDAVVEDIGVDAVKIGMLHAPEIVRTVAAAIERHRLQRVVLDPVMIATSGAVLIGEAPRCPSFDENFGWEDAVVPMPYGTADPAAVIDALEGDPERVEAIRRRNVSSSLRRHDLVYRWERVLDAVGLQPTPAVAERRERLAQLAAEVEGGVHRNGGTPPTVLRRAA